MDDSQTNWCAVCDRQIVPKRSIVPVSHDIAPPRKQNGRTGLVQVKTRVEIDQSPAPLYCSDQCRQRDIEYYHGPPQFSDSGESSSSSGSEGSSSIIQRKQAPRKSTPNTRSLAVLREIGIVALPAPTSETYDEDAPPRKQQPAYRPPEYTSGVMMANRRLEALLPKPLKPGERPPPLKPVPGWTDGSQAWRASTYSFAPPPRTRADVLDPNRAAYGSCVASPHRSASSGVIASSSSSSYFSAPESPTASSFTSGTSVDSELLSSFEDNFSKRTSSRLSLFPSSPSSSPASCSSSPPRRQRNLSEAANNMLLVPDVLVRPPSRSSSCNSLPRSQPHPSGRRHSAGSASLQGPRIRSPLSTSSLNEEETTFPEPEDEEEAAFVRSCGIDALPPRRRPKTEMRSWSYDNVRTYPIMPMPTLKEVRIIDGKEVEVEVPRKGLFSFEPMEVPVRA